MIDTKAKRELAANATPGPWAYEPHGDTGDYGIGIVINAGGKHVRGRNDDHEALVSETVAVEVKGSTNAAFIASNDPDEVNPMRDEIDRLRGLVGRMAEGLKPFAYGGNDAAALVAEAKKETEG